MELKMHHATKAKAEKLVAMLAAEYPALTLNEVAREDDAERLDHFTVTHADGETIYEGPKVPELADLLETCEDMDLDPETHSEEDEEELKVSGSVVPENYRRTYREVSSTGQSCGDWLAEQLAMDTLDAAGKFVVGDFDAILNNNEVDMTGKWASLPQSGQKGWIGRYRMNGRQVLEKAVLISGVYKDATASVHFPPTEWLQTMAAKHAKWLERETKAAKEAVGA